MPDWSKFTSWEDLERKTAEQGRVKQEASEYGDVDEAGEAQQKRQT